MISRQFNHITIIIFILFNSSLIAQSDKPYELLDRVKKNISSKNIHYEFIIENNLPEINNSINGNLYLSSEKYVLLTNDIEQIFDGEKTYTIIHENEEVLIDNKENSILSLKPDILFDFLNDKYKLSMIKTTINTSTIKAEDNNNPGQFYEISINVNDLSIIHIKQGREVIVLDDKSFEIGIPQIHLDKLKDKVFGIENNLDELNGIDFKKGCYIGQENTSRIKLRNKLRRRILPVEKISGEVFENDIIKFNENEIGKILIDKPYTFALIKVVEPDLKDFADIELVCGKSKIKINKPDWI